MNAMKEGETGKIKMEIQIFLNGKKKNVMKGKRERDQKCDDYVMKIFVHRIKWLQDGEIKQSPLKFKVKKKSSSKVNRGN